MHFFHNFHLTHLIDLFLSEHFFFLSTLSDLSIVHVPIHHFYLSVWLMFTNSPKMLNFHMEMFSHPTIVSEKGN